LSTHVSAEQITWENAAGERTVIKLSSLTGSGPQPKDRNGLLLWGVFYQLVELNQRLGGYDQEGKAGSGMTGLLAQLRVSNLETSDKLGKLLEVMERLESQASAAQSNAQSPQQMMTQALEMVRNLGIETPAGGFPTGGPGRDNGSGD
jgi:hypothetical protein